MKYTTSAIPLGLSLALGIWTTGCDFSELHPEPGYAPAVMLQVVNDNAHDIDLYLLHNGERLRIARLWAGETGDVELGTLKESCEITLEAYAIGLNATYQTTPITVMGDTYIHLRVGDVLEGSTFSVSYGEEPDSIPSTTGETI